MISSEQTHHFTVTVPAGTLKAAPQTTNMDIGRAVTTGFTVDIPHGHLGLMGWRIVMSPNAPVVPLNGDFVVFEGRSREYPVDSMPDSGAWQLQAYNTGVQPHIIRVTVHSMVFRPREPNYRQRAGQLIGLANAAAVVDVTMSQAARRAASWRHRPHRRARWLSWEGVTT